MAEARDYFLSEEQLRARFEERVRDFVFSGLRFPRDARRADSRSGRSRERRSDDACPQKIPA
ncbi:hypothetical protein, partial [Streptomyces sp. NPDC058424]|uniref:hypothetical protein n=1 Tax=Streptomyces sp. NPDC058424 TaxID=3346491 RepID=UPI003646313C